MKTNVKSKEKTSHPRAEVSKRPQNKDVLDSREGEEEILKGSDTTHNKKEKKSERRKA